MAATEEPLVVKRGPGRPAKRQKTSSPAPQSPAVMSPMPDKKMPGLPSKVSDNRPLPGLTEPQPPSLSDDEYQSVAASAVLATSLEQSRLRWVSEGIFDRYWVKPEGGKNGKPPPPNNPDVKRMKSHGECRIRIEPHLFVAEMYLEEGVKAPTVTKQPMAQYKPAQQYGQQYQHRGLPPAVPQAPQSQPPRVPYASSATGTSSSTPGSGPKPDPVISMLATRASSDPELKSLMKEVATGNATQDQLKVFQKHIDELTIIITKQKQDEEDSAAKAYQQANTIQYDGSADVRTTAIAGTTTRHTSSPQPYSPAQTGPQYGQQQPWMSPVPAATDLPVIIAFKDVGATEDRFLFPQHSVLEALSPQHLLVSFIVVRRGHQAVDNTSLKLSAEYWQPVTIMIEVAYGKEELLNHIRRWVKPAEEVRKYMEDVMQRCERAPETYLALRLPFRSTAATESENVSKEATPVVEERTKPRPVNKAIKTKRASSIMRTKSDAGTESPTQVGAVKSEEATAPTPTLQQPSPSIEVSAENEAGGRPKRTTRKSVRISEG